MANTADLDVSLSQELERVFLEMLELRNYMGGADLSTYTALMRHEKNAQIELVDQCGFLVGRHDVYRGVTPTLQRLFWPETSGNPMLASLSKSERPPAEAAMPSRMQKHPACKLHTAAHGKIVHTELGRITDIVNRQGRTREALLEALHVELPRPDPCTLAFASCLLRQRWFPLTAEFKVWIAELRLATAIDLIAYDLCDHVLVVIELKNYNLRELYGPASTDRMLPPPFDDMANCHLNRHLIQLLTTRLLLERGYGGMRGNTYVVMTREGLFKRICLHRFTGEWEEKLDTLYGILLSYAATPSKPNKDNYH